MFPVLADREHLSEQGIGGVEYAAREIDAMPEAHPNGAFDNRHGRSVELWTLDFEIYLRVYSPRGRILKVPPSGGWSMCLAYRRSLFSLSSPAGGEGRGEEAHRQSSLGLPPPRPSPPLVPRGEREKLGEYAKHIPAGKPPEPARWKAYAT